MPIPYDDPSYRYPNDNRPAGSDLEQYNYPSQGLNEGLMGTPATNKGHEGYYPNDNRTRVGGAQGYYPNDNRPDPNSVDSHYPNSNYITP